MYAATRSRRFRPVLDSLSQRIAPSGGISPLQVTIVEPGLPDPPPIVSPLSVTLVCSPTDPVCEATLCQ